MRSDFSLSSSTVLTRVSLLCLVAIFFLPASSSAQLFHYDTRYQPIDSFAQGQVLDHGLIRVPIFYAQPEPSPFQQTVPMAHQQHVEFPAIGQTLAEPFPTQEIQEMTLQDTILPSMTSQAFPTEITPPFILGTHETTPTAVNPFAETPTSQVSEPHSIIPAPATQEIPEGYDPAYPIEFPGESFQGYYPTAGGVIAPPTDHAEKSISEIAPSMPDEAPTVPSVVVEEDEAGIVMPEPGAIIAPDTTNEADEQTLAGETDAADALTNRPNDSGDAGEVDSDESIADAINKLKRQIQEADLRAEEAEEKAHAIARQAAKDQEKLDQLKAELAKSRNALKKMKARAAKNEPQPQAKNKPSTAVTADSVSDSKTSRTGSDSDTIQLDSETDEPVEATQNAPSKQAVAAAKKASVVEDGPPSDASLKGPSDTPAKAPETSNSKKQTLREKIAKLEKAREKQLASAAQRIETEFQKKINAKLESGKTEKHPEVKLLKESLRERLEDSNGKIRRRYQRQINRMWKEAAARSRS